MTKFREHLDTLYHERENADAAWDAFHWDDNIHDIRFSLTGRRLSGRYKRLGQFELPAEQAKLAMERVIANLSDSIETLHDTLDKPVA